MKSIGVILVSLILFSCLNKKEQKRQQGQIQLQPVYDSLVEDFDFDTIFNKMDCSDEEDSLIEQKIVLIHDSIVGLYDQLILRLKIQSTNEKIKPFAVDFIDALNKSKDGFNQMADSDAELFYNSFGKATGAGAMTRCFRLNTLQNRLIFLKGIFGHTYWNYGFDTIKQK